jgi:glycine betaine/proline transport system substrate-binding protein
MGSLMPTRAWQGLKGTIVARSGGRLYDEPAQTCGRARATKTNGKLLATILALLMLGSLSLTGCGAPGQGKVLTLANIGWDENVAVSNLTKVVLEEDLGYERVEIDTSDKLGATYSGVASGDLDAFQDVWLPNQEALLDRVAADVEHLDPWFLGETKQGMAVPAYMDVRSIDQLNGTDVQLIWGIEESSVMMHKVSGQVIPAYGLKQQLVEAPTAGMLYEVGSLYAAREDFVFLAWSPHWMNRSYDIRYLQDPKDALGPTNDLATCSTIVRGSLRGRDPEAYAFMDALELTEGQIEGLEVTINEEGSPLAGARRWISENREVVRPWLAAARNAS